MHLYTNESDIDTTSNHPFYVIGKGWVAAGDLVEGDEVYNLDGTTTTVTGYEVEKLDEPVLVYNLEVEDFHSYFVGCVPVLVHNYETTIPKDVSAFGSSPNGDHPGPRPARPDKDFEVASNSSFVGGDPNHGASTFIDPKKSQLKGYYYTLPKGTKLPYGLGYRRDGVDVLPGSPHKPGHGTIFPTFEMTVEMFNKLFLSLPWCYGGKII